MKYFFVAIALAFSASALFAQPAWQLQLITSDFPLTESCSGGEPLTYHSQAFFYYDDNLNGPDPSDPYPECVSRFGFFCDPDAAVFSDRNFALQADGTVRSPIFSGWESAFQPPHGDLHVYVRVFIGENDDFCFTSPVITAANGGGLVIVTVPREAWTCSSADVSVPPCYSNPSYMEAMAPYPPDGYCTDVCRGGSTLVAVLPDPPELFRPPIIQASAGCDSGCGPSEDYFVHADNWERLAFGGIAWWLVGVSSRDGGCITLEISDTSSCAHLDTMTLVEVGNGVAIHWSTAWESALDSFHLWQKVPGTTHVVNLPATRDPNGSDYSYYHEAAFEHGNYIAYLLVMVDDSGRQNGAAYLELHRTTGADSRTLPENLALLSAWPNPFNMTSTISMSVPNMTTVTLGVFDVVGRHVVTLHDGMLEAGEHRFTFDASALPSGIYFARVQAGEFVKTQKLLLLK